MDPDVTTTLNTLELDSMKNRTSTILTTLYLGRGKHRAICGNVDVSAKTEIELVQALNRHGIHLKDYKAENMAGRPNGPFSWTWVRK